MMETSREITVLQATIILINTNIGVGILALPRIVAQSGGSGAPMITLFGIIGAFVCVTLISILGMRFPNQTIIGYSQDIAGKWVSWIGGALIILYFAILNALTTREFGEVVVTSVLRKTPLEVTVIVMLLLAAITTRNDTTTITYIHHFYSPIIVGPALLIVVLSLKNAEMIRLLPIMGNEPHRILITSLTITALFQGAFIQTIVIPSMRKPKGALKAGLWGVGIAGTLYLLIVVATIAVFGAEETKILLWPTLELAKATSLPGNLLERLDAAFLAVWVTAVFTTLLSSYYLTIQATKELLRLKDHKMFSLFFIPFIFVLAMIPQNIHQMYRYIEIFGRFGLILTILYPGLLLVTAMIRKKKDGSRETKPIT